MSGAYAARDVLTNTIDTVSENKVGCTFTLSKQAFRVRSHHKLQLTYTHHSNTLMLAKTCLQEPAEADDWYESELCKDEVWKLNKALYGCRKAPKLWHQHVVGLLKGLNYDPPLTDPSCFRNDEPNTYLFIHVDDGLLFGPRIEVFRLVEFLSNQIVMRIVGRIERLGDKMFFLGRVIVKTAR